MNVLALEFESETQEWIDQRLSEGRYVDAAEYLRDLIRKDMTQNGESGVEGHAVPEGLSCK
jgi:Arc/MetJ-type ribon-helix-helix transcriptional regulator